MCRSFSVHIVTGQNNDRKRVASSMAWWGKRIRDSYGGPVRCGDCGDDESCICNHVYDRKDA